MITGIHALIYSKDAAADRAFFRDTLGFRPVDAGDGWLIFRLPPAELGVHPDEAGGVTHFSLMCDDVQATMEELTRKGVEFVRGIKDEGYGLVTALKLPGGGELALYQPRHPTAI
jgi:catechol 2,3-dioxygenase-like lactoylglutathione lyase family enzyme